MKELKEKVYVLYRTINKTKKEELGIFSSKDEAEEARLEAELEYNSSKLFIREEMREKSFADIDAEGEVLEAILGDDEDKDFQEEEKVVNVVVVTATATTPPEPKPILVIEKKVTVTSSDLSSEDKQLKGVISTRKPVSTATTLVVVGGIIIAGVVIAAACSKK